LPGAGINQDGGNKFKKIVKKNLRRVKMELLKSPIGKEIAPSIIAIGYKMIELLRNCAHGSEIANISGQRRGSICRILKVATTVEGIDNLGREIKGWNWYLKAAKREIIKRAFAGSCEEDTTISKSKCIYQGHKNEIIRQALIGNKDIIKRAIEHYLDIWAHDNDVFPVHGDLSVDNHSCPGAALHH